MTSVSISTIYCLATGKPIAEINDDELGFVLESFGDIGDLNEREAALIRLTLVSMRPSLPWMSITRDRVEIMRKIAPKELLAYLLNRLYAPIERPTASRIPSSEAMFSAKMARIEMWQLIESMDFAPDELEQLLLILLELDSTFNLATMVKPLTVLSVWLCKDPLHRKAYIDSLNDWRSGLMEKKLKDERQARMSREYWANGNKLTGKALFNSFMETKPLTPTAAKKTKKKAEQDMFDSILAGMFADETPIGLQPSVEPMTREAKGKAFIAAIKPTQSSTVLKPAGKKLVFGVKSNG